MDGMREAKHKIKGNEEIEASPGVKERRKREEKKMKSGRRKMLGLLIAS